jgi:lipopolysaccharide export system permease protein
MRTKILDRYVVWELVFPFLFGVAAFTSIFFAGSRLLELTQYVLQNGVSVWTAMEMVLLSLPSIIVFTLPMSCLVAVLIAFSRMSMESEIVALYASGISLYRTVLPVVFLGIVVTGLGFGLSEYIVPASARASQTLEAHALKQQLSTNKPFVFIDPGTKAIIYIGGGFDAKTKSMRDIIVTERKGDQPSIIFQAKRAHWEQGYNWRLEDGTMRTFQPDGSTMTVSFKGMRTHEIDTTPSDIMNHQSKPEDMSFRELKSYISKVGGTLPPTDFFHLQVQLYNKLAIPLAALVFAFVAAPLAVSPRRGSPSVGVGLSILIIFMYWFVWHFTTALAIQGSLPPKVGAFTADVLGLILGMFLLVRSAK